MTQADAEKQLGRMIDLVRQHFYRWRPFKIDGIYEVVPVILVSQEHHPDALPFPILKDQKKGTETVSVMQMGIEVTQPLLDLDDNSVLFGLAHELGHGFSATLMSDWGLQSIDKDCTPEIVADLGAAFVLNKLGISWLDILKTVRAWRQTEIFTAGWSGQHPPGDMRKAAVESLVELMVGGTDFTLAAKGITLSMLGVKP